MKPPVLSFLAIALCSTSASADPSSGPPPRMWFERTPPAQAAAKRWQRVVPSQPATPDVKGPTLVEGMRAAALRAQGPKESESRRSYQHPKLLLRSLHGLAKTQLFRDVATVARGLGLGEVPLAKVGPAGSEQRGNLVYQVYIRRGFQVRGPDRTSRDPKESDFVGALAGKHPTSPVKRNITRRQLINAARQFITDNATAAKQAYDKKWRETSAYQR